MAQWLKDLSGNYVNLAQVETLQVVQPSLNGSSEWQVLAYRVGGNILAHFDDGSGTLDQAGATALLEKIAEELGTFDPKA